MAAKNGEEALAFIEERHPALAILDVSMPFRSGMEVGRALREKQAGIPIIFLTSRTQEEDVLEGFLSGATDYMFKPFSPRELQMRVKAVLART